MKTFDYAGPWFINDKVENADIGHRAIIDQDGYTVCRTSSMGEGYALLISAAPDLMRSCVALLVIAELEGWRGIGIAEAKAAISKASGGKRK